MLESRRSDQAPLPSIALTWTLGVPAISLVSFCCWNRLTSLIVFEVAAVADIRSVRVMGGYCRPNRCIPEARRNRATVTLNSATLEAAA